MSTSPSRSPPVLARVLCPFCGRFWFRHHEAGSTQEIEIRCRGVDCRRLITFRMVNGTVHIEAVIDRS